MVMLVVNGWDEAKRWVGSNAWPRSSLIDSLERCVNMPTTDIKRIVRSLLKREKMQIPIRNRETAAHALHILESQGAMVTFED
jgi:hypothetical protein